MLAGAAVLPASAALYTSASGYVNGSGTSLNLAIPAGNPSGVSSSMTVSTLPDNNIQSMTVTLNVSGGYNGSLYAYLSYDGTLVTLLNRVGTGEGSEPQTTFGFSTSGFNNITLADGSMSNIHDVQNPVSGTTYGPDGGNLASFNGANPNGTWTLFFASMAGGDTSTLEGWSLDITAVPEPVNLALVIFGGLVVVWNVVCWRRNRVLLA
jgi:subtilisin-like proprotein convertase family protein